MGPPPHDAVYFDRRPSASPAIAALLAAETITKSDRILVLGSGQGEDALLLAAAGVRVVRGYDEDGAAVEIARAAARKLGIQDRVSFTPRRLPEALDRTRPASYDVAIDTLTMNNVRAQATLTRTLARVLVGGGLWVAHVRDLHARPYRRRRARELFPEVAAEYFDFGFAYPTHLAEHPYPADDRVDASSVYVAIARRRAR